MRKAAKIRLEKIRDKYSLRGEEKAPPPRELMDAEEALNIEIFDENLRPNLGHPSRECEMMLYALAELAFGKGRRGRPPNSKAWNHSKLFELGEVAELYRNQRSNTKIAKLIAAKHKQFHASFDTIRRQLPEALRVREEWRKWEIENYQPEPPDDERGDDHADQDYGYE
jgi:hypothetical protein